jgi:hypothetical protein
MLKGKVWTPSGY